jgi:hypothetical protein
MSERSALPSSWDAKTVSRARRLNPAAIGPAARMRREERLGVADDQAMSCADGADAVVIANVEAVLPHTEPADVPVMLNALEATNGCLTMIGARPRDPKTGEPMNLPDALEYMGKHHRSLRAQGRLHLLNDEDDGLDHDGDATSCPPKPSPPKPISVTKENDASRPLRVTRSKAPSINASKDNRGVA